MRHHFAHLNRIDVSNGQSVSKGQQIGLMGKTGTTSVHLHWEVQKIFRTWTSYTQGMNKQQVLNAYKSPYEYDWKSVAPFSHLGWDWLSDIGKGQLHPGIDINSGSGDTDLNTPIKSPVDGKIVFIGESSGWGKHIFIEEGEIVNNALTPEQAKMIYNDALLREPENGQVIFNRQLDEMLGGVKNELTQRFQELENKPPVIKEVENIVDNPVQTKEIERLNCLLESKDDDIEAFKKERNDALLSKSEAYGEIDKIRSEYVLIPKNILSQIFNKWRKK